MNSQQQQKAALYYWEVTLMLITPYLLIHQPTVPNSKILLEIT